MILGFGVLMFERGFFWTREQAVIRDSDFYLALHHIMPIWIWGVLAMMFSAFFIIVAPFFLPTQKLNNVLIILFALGVGVMRFSYFLDISKYVSCY